MCIRDRNSSAYRCVAELQLLGYPNQVLKKMLAGITQRPLRRLRGVAQRYLRACKSEYGFGKVPAEEVRELMFELHIESVCRLELLQEEARRVQ